MQHLFFLIAYLHILLSYAYFIVLPFYSPEHTMLPEAEQAGPTHHSKHFPFAYF